VVCNLYVVGKVVLGYKKDGNHWIKVFMWEFSVKYWNSED
jgi:hypothetical protein